MNDNEWLSQISEFSAILNFLICFRKFDWKRDTRHSFLEFVAKSGQKFIKNSQKKCKFDEENEINRKFNFSIAKKFWRFLTKKLRLENGPFFPNFRQWIPKRCKGFPRFLGFDSKTVHRSALCRSRRELSNEYLLAKIGVDTAENEPLEVWGKLFNIIQSCP